VLCLHTPARFFAIGEWYGDFSQVTDEEVTILLGKAAALLAGPGSEDPDTAEVMLNIAGARLPGSLVLPDRAAGLVVFAHGSGSSRHSPPQPARRRCAEPRRGGHAASRSAHSG
jgi:putative phosphoribosyl transferase